MCARCGQPLSLGVQKAGSGGEGGTATEGEGETHVSVEGKRYHKKCFYCEVCGVPFPSLEVYSCGGRTVCEECASRADEGQRMTAEVVAM